MASINLTTLFGGINPLNSTYITPVNFRAGENIGTFNFGELEGNKDKYTFS